MLVDAGDPLAPFFAVGNHRRWLATEANLAAVRLAKAGQDTDESRFAGPIASDEPMRLAGQYAKARVAERDSRAIALRDAGRFHNRKASDPSSSAELSGSTSRSSRTLSYLGLFPQNALSSTLALVTKGAES